MNYYIQGSPARAEEIKAAFKKLCYDTGNLEFTSSLLYYTIEGKVELMCPKSLQNIIKTHPDYKELELPVEPKFKVGDWVAGIDDEGDMATEKIVSFSHNKVLLVDTDGCRTEYPKTELSNFHPWTIQDAKDGDVLVYQDEIFLVELVGNNSVLYHCCFDGELVVHSFYALSNEDLLHVHPATKEQRNLLFTKMKEAGYKWDTDKKELRKIKPHYDISNFKPFDKVLVRFCDGANWCCALFSHYCTRGNCHFVCSGGSVTQCIPYEGNKHLLGTTDMCDEYYINW